MNKTVNLEIMIREKYFSSEIGVCQKDMLQADIQI